MTRSVLLAFVCALAFACGPGEEPEVVARRVLSEEGYTGLVLTPSGEGTFEFTGTDDSGATCTGTISVETTAIGSSHKWSRTCSSYKAPPPCAVATPEACVQLGLDKNAAGDPRAAAAAWKTGCEGNSGVSCNNVAVLLMEGKLGPADAVGAAVYLDLGCEHGYGDACGARAQLHLNATPPDAAKAFALFKRGCELSEKVCYTAATKAYNGVGTPVDHALAASLAEQGCKRNAHASCGFFGLLLVTGQGVEKDAARGEPLMRAACKEDDREACANLGVVLRDGMGVSPKDSTAAFGFFARACDLGYGAACQNAALAYDNGDGIAQDQAKALLVYRKACDLDVGAACFNAGVDYRDGLGTAPDAQLAAEYFEKACKLGVARACD